MPHLHPQKFQPFNTNNPKFFFLLENVNIAIERCNYIKGLLFSKLLHKIHYIFFLSRKEPFGFHFIYYLPKKWFRIKFNYYLIDSFAQWEYQKKCNFLRGNKKINQIHSKAFRNRTGFGASVLIIDINAFAGARRLFIIIFMQSAVTTSYPITRYAACGECLENRHKLVRHKCKLRQRTTIKIQAARQICIAECQ